MTDRPKHKRKLRWDGTPRTIPKHPALIIAPVLFVVATGYSWWRWRQREQKETDDR